MTSLYWLSWKWNDIFKYLKVSDTEDNQILSLQSWNLVSLRQKERTEYIHLHFYFFLNPEVFEWCSLIRLQRISQFISWMGPNVGRPTLSKLGCLWGLGGNRGLKSFFTFLAKENRVIPLLRNHPIFDTSTGTQVAFCFTRQQMNLRCLY